MMRALRMVNPPHLLVLKEISPARGQKITRNSSHSGSVQALASTARKMPERAGFSAQAKIIA
jgi:hypothetical protein